MVNNIKILSLASMTIALALILGCSGGGSDPIGVNLSNPAVGSNSGDMTSRPVWGMWHCYMEPGSGQIITIPLRSATFTANVTNLLEIQPGNLLIEDLDTTDFLTEGRLGFTVKLTHPFPGLDRFNGFDVWGVFLHNGASALNYDGLTYSGGPDAGENEAVALNPDGYTRWFNQPEFDGDGLPLLEYWPGKLSNLPEPTAAINPYKIFADGLAEEDDYYQWISTPGNADDRGIFRAGAVNSRRWEVVFPIIGNSPVVQFQYAVVATWEPGDPALTGDPLIYDPFDFPTSANCDEAFFVQAVTDQSNLYYDESTGLSGGTFRADIEVFDWQGGSVGELGVPNEVESIIIEGDFVPGGSHQFMQAELATVAIPGTQNSSVFQVEIINCAPQTGGDAELWVIVESAGLNGESYYQGFPDIPYPDGARRASFLPGIVAISGEPTLDIIYVDDSNTSGIEDGTQAHPYNTIQEGIDSTPGGYEIWVDDSGNAYEEQVIMKSNIIVRSRNWETSDGTNRAFIDGPDVEVSYSVHFYNVDNAVLDGFRIGFAYIGDLGYPWWDTTEMLRIDGGSNITIQDCLFTGLTNMVTVYPVAAFSSVNLTVENCRMASMDYDTSHNGCMNVFGVYAESCPGITLRNNVFGDIRSNPGGSHCEINAWYINGSANAVVKNNLIYHVTPPAPDMANCMKGFFLENCTDPEVANNTVDDVDTSDAFFINQCFAYWFSNCTGVEFTNNIASRLYSSGNPPPLARGVSAFYADPVICDFTDVYDIGPGGYGADYFGDASAGVGAISGDPDYIDPDNGQYDISAVSPARWGDPGFVDWDDTGAPSGDPENYDTNTRSRMGCHGGPGGEIVGLLTPE